jgi:hypothetical protein
MCNACKNTHLCIVSSMYVQKFTYVCISGRTLHTSNTAARPFLCMRGIQQLRGSGITLRNIHRPQGFATLCEGCRQLQSIDMVGVMTMTDEMLGCMHKLFASLRVVRLGGCSFLSSEALAKFIKVALCMCIGIVHVCLYVCIDLVGQYMCMHYLLHYLLHYLFSTCACTTSSLLSCALLLGVCL